MSDSILACSGSSPASILGKAVGDVSKKRLDALLGATEALVHKRSKKLGSFGTNKAIAFKNKGNEGSGGIGSGNGLVSRKLFSLLVSGGSSTFTDTDPARTAAMQVRGFDDCDIKDEAFLVRTRGVGVYHDVSSDLTSSGGPFLDEHLEGTVRCRLDSFIGNESIFQEIE